MKITDEECEEFRQLYRENEEIELTLDEAREMIASLCFLFERFASWVAQEKAQGHVLEAPEVPGVREDTAQLQ